MDFFPPFPTIWYPLSFEINLYGPNKWSILTSKEWEDGMVPYGKWYRGLLKELGPSSPSQRTVIVPVRSEIMLFFVFLIKLKRSLEAIWPLLAPLCGECRRSFPCIYYWLTPPLFSSLATIHKALQIKLRFGSRISPLFNLLRGEVLSREKKQDVLGCPTFTVGETVQGTRWCERFCSLHGAWRTAQFN